MCHLKTKRCWLGGLITDCRLERFAIIFVALAIIVLLCSFCTCGWGTSNYGDFTGGLAACLISLANAALLFLTLNRQDHSFKQERFETTFFKLFEMHKKLTGDLEIVQIVPKEYAESVKPQVFKGLQCFSFANYERYTISKSLLAERHDGYYDESDTECINHWYDEVYNNFDDPEKRDKCQKMVDKVTTDNVRKYYNLTYKISEERYNAYHEKIKELYEQGNEEIAASICHRIFHHPYRFLFDPYIRSFEQLMKFIYISKPNDESGHKYMEILISQMSKFEIRFIICHALCHAGFKQVLDETGMSDVLKEKGFTKN